MIRSAMRRVMRALASARLATLLLVFVAVWAILASFVAQGAASDASVTAWGSANPALEPVVRALGLHQAFSSPIFLVAVALLALSTAVCAWQRTKVARTRARLVRAAARGDEAPLAERHDVAIPVPAVLDGATARAAVAEALERLGIRAKPRGEDLVAVSRPWASWGSPVFHWALLALILTIPLGNLVRASGQMGIAVGRSKPDAPASYGLLSAGPLKNWGAVQRTIRVDAFDVNYKFGGVNRGPTPTVAVLGPDGAVIKVQRVYPNETLKLGSLTIYPFDYGLSASISVLDAAGSVTATSTELIDFAGTAPGGTAPLRPLEVRGRSGDVANLVYASVPLDRVEAGYLGKLPATPVARLRVTSAAGGTVVDTAAVPGQAVALPDGRALRLDAIGYYARLQLVDDPSIPLLYLGAVVALLGLAVATLTQQLIVTAGVIDTPDGPAVALRARLWRNVSNNRDAIAAEIVSALDAAAKGQPS